MIELELYIWPEPEANPMPQFAITEAMLVELDALADVARPIDDDDWGSERQVEAQNAFFIRVEAILPRDQFEELEGFCLKANVDEMVDEAMRLIADLRPCTPPYVTAGIEILDSIHAELEIFTGQGEEFYDDLFNRLGNVVAMLRGEIDAK